MKINNPPLLNIYPSVQSTPVRSIGTRYQNLLDIPLYVVITLYSSAPSANQVTAHCADDDTPSTQVAVFQQNATVHPEKGVISFIVLPNFYYKLVLYAWSVVIDSLIEWY